MKKSKKKTAKKANSKKAKKKSTPVKAKKKSAKKSPAKAKKKSTKKTAPAKAKKKVVKKSKPVAKKKQTKKVAKVSKPKKAVKKVVAPKVKAVAKPAPIERVVPKQPEPIYIHREVEVETELNPSGPFVELEETSDLDDNAFPELESEGEISGEGDDFLTDNDSSSDEQ